MNSFKKQLTVTVAAVAMLSLSPAPVEAQSGSRLCGWIAIETPQKMGLLYEARKSEAMYDMKCDAAVSSFMQKINANPQLKAMKWEKVHKATCESVGQKGFINAGESPDICEKMKANKPYQVTKAGSASAVYTQK